MFIATNLIKFVSKPFLPVCVVLCFLYVHIFRIRKLCVTFEEFNVNI